MNVHKVELYIVDHDDVGADGIRTILENAHYPNRCIMPNVASVKTVDIGKWRDDHPLNMRTTCLTEYERMFGETK